MANSSPSSASKPRSLIDTNNVPATDAEFVEIFGPEKWQQTSKIVIKTVEKMLGNVCFFKEAKIVENAYEQLSRIPDLDERFLRHPFLKSLLAHHVKQMEWKVVDDKGTITSPQWWIKEQSMIAMAGEKTMDHYLPQAVVGDNLGRRTWVDAKNIPEEFLFDLRADNEATSGNLILVRDIVAFAKKKGIEVFGVNMEWNDEIATGISGDNLGVAQEFIDSIEDAKSRDQDWFVNPVLFIGDDWNSAEAKKLKKACKDANVEAYVLQREGITGEQVQAVFECTYKQSRVSNVVGKAGTGKTFSVKTVCDSYEACGYDIMGAALGWCAAKVLSGSTGLPDKSCRALEGFLGAIAEAKVAGVDFFVGPTLIVVDESGMVGVRHMHSLIELTRDSKQNVKIVLTGDPLQVAPVEAGNAFETLIQHYGAAEIKTIRRQKQPSHRKAVMNFSLRNSGLALNTFMHQEMVQFCPTKDDMLNRVVQEFVSYRVAQPEKKCLILALENKDVLELNRRIRLVYRKAGLIHPDEIILDVTDGTRKMKTAFSVGDEVVLRSNDKNLPVYYIPEDATASVVDETQWSFKTTGVFNRNSGRIVAIKPSSHPAGSYDFVVDLEGEDPSRIVINSRRFKHPEKGGMPMLHNFATTIYASQGMTIPNILLLDAPQMNFRLAYVGCSRHTENLTIFVNETELHRRIDEKAQRVASKRVDLKNKDDEVKVKIGRFTRSQMIQTMAVSWRSRQDNFTAHTFREIGDTVYETAQVRELHSKLKPDSNNEENIVDFIPEFNKRYQMVDIEKILALPDPIGKSTYWRPSDVDDHRASIPVYESPIIDDNDSFKSSSVPLLSPRNGDETGESMMMKAANMLRRFARQPEIRLPSIEEQENPSVEKPSVGESKEYLPPGYTPAEEDSVWRPSHGKPSAPFKPKEGKELAEHLEKEASLLQRLEANLSNFMGSKVQKPKGLDDLPLLPIEKTIGLIDEAGVLKFDNVPQSIQEDGSYAEDPTSDFLTAPSTKLWWGVGRGNEPRILARDDSGQIVARYRLNGECVVGDGFPPFAFSPQPNKNTPVMIVPGPKEWFLLQEFYNKKGGGDYSKMPHIVWGAQDVDWGNEKVIKLLANKEMIIVRSKTDESQIPWALDLKKELENRWGLRVRVNPPVPGHENDLGYHPTPEIKPTQNENRRFSMGPK